MRADRFVGTFHAGWSCLPSVGFFFNCNQFAIAGFMVALCGARGDSLFHWNRPCYLYSIGREGE